MRMQSAAGGEVRMYTMPMRPVAELYHARMLVGVAGWRGDSACTQALLVAVSDYTYHGYTY